MIHACAYTVQASQRAATGDIGFTERGVPVFMTIRPNGGVIPIIDAGAEPLL
jgi:hypothetical protein